MGFPLAGEFLVVAASFGVSAGRFGLVRQCGWPDAPIEVPPISWSVGYVFWWVFS